MIASVVKTAGAPFPVRRCRILHAPIRMKHQSRCRALPFYSHAECRQGQRRIDAVGKRIPHHLLGAKVFYNCRSTPRKDCAVDAPTDFSSDCTEMTQNTVVFQGIFVRYDGKFVSRCCAKPSGVLCVVPPLIQPSLPGWNVCNIANPDSIWLRNLKIPVQQIQCNRMGMPGVCGAFVCECARGLDVQLLHQPVDPLSGQTIFLRIM